LIHAGASENCQTEKEVYIGYTAIFLFCYDWNFLFWQFNYGGI